MKLLQRGCMGDVVLDEKLGVVHKQVNNASMLDMEVSILLQLQASTVASNVVTFLDYQKESKCITLKYESGGDLQQLVESKGALSYHGALYIYKTINNVLCVLHSLGYAHLDVSLENIFLSPDGNVKLGDFGLSELCQNSSSSAVLVKGRGKQMYAAPEMLDTRLQCPSYDARCADSYSLGIVLFICIVGGAPFDTGAWRGHPTVRRLRDNNWCWETTFQPLLNPFVSSLLNLLCTWDCSLRTFPTPIA